MRGKCEVGIARWGDFAKVYKGKFLKIFILCALDITEVTSHPKSLQVHVRQLCHLAWTRDDFGWKCVTCPLQKPPHMTILTSHGNCHLASTFCALVSSCPIHHAKVTPHDHSHLMWQLSPHVPSCQVVFSTMQKLPCMTILTWYGYSHLVSTSRAPLHAKIIYFTSHGKIPKEVTQQPPFHQLGTPYEPPITNIFYIILRSR